MKLSALALLAVLLGAGCAPFHTPATPTMVGGLYDYHPGDERYWDDQTLAVRNETLTHETAHLIRSLRHRYFRRECYSGAWRDAALRPIDSEIDATTRNIEFLRMQHRAVKKELERRRRGGHAR